MAAAEVEAVDFEPDEDDLMDEDGAVDVDVESLSLDSDGTQGPQRSSDGWIILVTGVHEDAQEDHIRDTFGDGKITNLHLNLDRRTGFVKGYALIEYEKYEDARAAIALNGTVFRTQAISVDWAFSKGPFRRRNMRRRSPRRSRSPRRRY